MQVAAEQQTFVGAVVFCFLAVGAVAQLLAVQAAVGNHRGDRQRNALVGGTKKHVEVVAKIRVYRLRVEFAQPEQLAAGNVCARIHKKRRVSAAFERERAKFEHLALNHKRNKVFLILFHAVILALLPRLC